jgi:hypothetical protein
MQQNSEVRISVWTNKFLGTEAKRKALLNLLETMNQGQWIPDCWNFFEPTRHKYLPGMQDQMIAGWIKDRPGSGKIMGPLLVRVETNSPFTISWMPPRTTGDSCRLRASNRTLVAKLPPNRLAKRTGAAKEFQIAPAAAEI